MEDLALKGTAGTEAKNDAVIQVELMGDSINIEIHSKVEKLYGQAIRDDVEQVLAEYSITGANILVNDLGAWDFVIKARTETAIKRALAKKEAVK